MDVSSPLANLVWIVLMGGSLYLLSRYAAWDEARKRLAKDIAANTTQITEQAVLPIDSTPRNLRVFDIDFRGGKAQGTLVLHQSSVTGVISRLLMLERKSDGKIKLKPIRLEPVTGKLDEAISLSAQEAKSIGESVFGKKKKPSKGKEGAQKMFPVAIPTTQAAASSPAEKTAQAPPQRHKEEASDKPIIKGFKSMYEGVYMSGKMEEHLKVEKGKEVRYSSYTVTLDTPDGPVQIQGNDLDRAGKEANVQVGQKVRILHMSNVTFGENKTKKLFSMINLSQENVL